MRWLRRVYEALNAAGIIAWLWPAGLGTVAGTLSGAYAALPVPARVTLGVGVLLLVAALVATVMPYLPARARRVSRQQGGPAVPSWPFRYPAWLNPYLSRKYAANLLIADGQWILKWMPKLTGDPIKDALLLSGSAAKNVSRWEEKVMLILFGRAPEFTSLFMIDDSTPIASGLLRAYLEKRLDELKGIHNQL
jgi:hypothetical protein